MATILLVEDGATVSQEVTILLEAAGHQVVRCGGEPTPLAACLLLRHDRCPFVDGADLVVFACTLVLPYLAAPTAASTRCAPTAPTPSTDGSRWSW